MPLFDAAGNIDGVAGTLNDVTERRLAGERLNEQLAFIATLVDSIPIPVYVKNRERRLTRVNRAYCEFFDVAPEDVKAVQTQLGVERAGELVERALAAIAQGLVKLGVRQLVVAGGETSGAVVNALGVKGLRIGPQIDPGVPWTAGLGDTPLALALKSGNFGTPDFFLKAWEKLP